MFNSWVEKSKDMLRVKWLGKVVLTTLLASSAIWTIPIAWATVFYEMNLIHVPFGPGVVRWW